MMTTPPVPRLARTVIRLVSNGPPAYRGILAGGSSAGGLEQGELCGPERGRGPAVQPHGDPRVRPGALHGADRPPAVRRRGFLDPAARPPLLLERLRCGGHRSA